MVSKPSTIMVATTREAVVLADMGEMIEDSSAAVRSWRRGSGCSGSGPTASGNSVCSSSRVARLDEAHGHRARPFRERSTSEYCWRSSNRSVVMAGSRRRRNWPAPLIGGGAGLAAFKPARTACRLRGRCRSRTGRRRAGRGRSSGPVRGGAVALPPDMERLGEIGPKRPHHDDLSSIHGSSGHFGS